MIGQKLKKIKVVDVESSKIVIVYMEEIEI